MKNQHRLRRFCFLVAGVGLVNLGLGNLGLVNLAAWGQAAPVWYPTMQWSSPEPFSCPDAQTASQLAKDAARGRTEPQATLGRVKLSSCKGMFDPLEGMRLLLTAAAKGSAHAQLAAAEAYRNGILGKADAANALYWYKRAALQDSARGRNSWAVALYLGAGASSRPAAAFKLFHISAQQGHREAQYNLGALYDLGIGTPQSYPDASRWYAKAAQQSDGAAEYRLGMLWELGLAGVKNDGVARQWYEKAERDHSVPAMLRLGLEPSRDSGKGGDVLFTAGVALLYGNGVPKDEAKGVAFLQKAADQHYPLAYFQLAEAYANGRGVKKNEARSIEYYEALLATDRNLAVAYNNIAWVLVTSTDAKIRDPQKALAYALKGVELSEGRQAYAIDTLAYAYFQAGQIDKAMEAENKALTLQPQNATYLASLNRFRNAQRHQRAAR